MMRVGDRLAAPIGLTSARWLLLCAIGRDTEEPTVGSLSEEAMLSTQNVSRMLASMEDDGLVERFSKPGAGRSVFVRLTPRGQDSLNQTDALAEQFEQFFLRSMPEDRTQQLEADLDQLINNLTDMETQIPTTAQVPTRNTTR